MEQSSRKTNIVIYVLELQNDKFYIGKSTIDHLGRALKSHFDGHGSSWTNHHGVVRVKDVFFDANNDDDDKYTMQMMQTYGIDNVRGGTYLDVDLDTKHKKFLEHEIVWGGETCFRCNRVGHFVEGCNANTDVNGMVIGRDEWDVDEFRRTFHLSSNHVVIAPNKSVLTCDRTSGGLYTKVEYLGGTWFVHLFNGGVRVIPNKLCQFCTSWSEKSMGICGVTNVDVCGNCSWKGVRLMNAVTSGVRSEFESAIVDMHDFQGGKSNIINVFESMTQRK